MQQRFAHISTFLFKHSYFDDGLFKSLDISFGFESQNLMKNFGIIIKTFSGGFHLLSSNPELLKSIGDFESVKLNFHTNDSYYINYTELPKFNISKEILYFSNVNKSFTAENQDFRIHEDEYVGRNEIMTISNGKIKISEFDENLDYKIIDKYNNEIPKKLTNIKDEFIVSNLPEGIIKVVSETTVLESIYYNPNVVWRKPLGILEIFPKELIKNFENFDRIEYSINFKNRHTKWKYFLVGPVYQNYHKLSIINKLKEEVFISPEKFKISEHTEAWVFESKNALPLSQLSDDTFQLVDKNNDDEDIRTAKVIIKTLPIASPSQLYTDNSPPNSTFYSHIYIN
ncbi:hypothetical protein [Urechidicola croceus]|uniref:Uncharacterized protein n=1 Tax=Urechidicola croceus TaxID=1850246 RepID=A0A1D8P812_9FLAO|nr:hypothetical protein [Urechidicola croceus]AOW20714.1 hypothetical protein LPB138_08505 [Urechidicola croceus]